MSFARRTARSPVGWLTVGAALLTASLVGVAHSPSTAAVAPISWVKCGSAVRLDCGTIDVPVDYAKPNGAKITMSVNRVKATSSSRRIGVLFVNPGGPGSSGVRFAERAANLFSDRVRAAYDIIGFDPRGTGASSPVKCMTPKQLDRFYAADPSPDTPAELEELFVTSELLAKGCESKVGLDVLKQLGTHNAVRDMDRLREALGEEKISMLGFSYGTLLGATYADMFPNRVQNFVLDGALDSNATFEERATEQAKGFELSLGLFVADCKARPSCVAKLGANPMDAVDKVLARVEKRPYVVGKRKVGPGEAMLGLIRPLYSQRRGWPLLEAALAEALSGSGRGLLELSDAYTDRQADGTYGSLLEANVAINCADARSPRDRDYYVRLAKKLVAVAPRYGAPLAYGNVPCGVWSFTSEFDGWKTRAAGAPPILVVGSRADPATPYVWAENMAKGLEKGVLLTWEGKSHTAYFGGNECIRSTVDDFLVKQIVPKPGTVCS